MRLGIEMRHVTHGPSGGISFLLRGVLRRLFVLHPEHNYFVFCTVFNRSLLTPLPSGVELIPCSTSHYWSELDGAAQKLGLDVLFRGYPVEDRLEFPLSRQIFQIPDIQHEQYPQFFDATALRARRRAFNRVLRSAGAIGTISDFARQTLLDQPCTQCRDIFLMPPALSEEQAALTPLTEAEEALLPKSKFFLMPANLWPHKNHRRALQAFERLVRNSGRALEFILTGHPDGWSELRAEFPDLPVRHLGFVRAPFLRRLYEQAAAVAYFSLYEGFGMPLLEAFAAGTPVLCSNTTSLPEIGRDAVLSCDPTNVETMCTLMKQVLEDEDLRERLIERGKERLMNYSWEQSAENLRAACERVAAKAAPSPATPSEAIFAWGLQDVFRPLVSIVTPSYNQGRFLRRTIESVLTQSYPHIEYQVMDGGSTDESLAILQSYGDRFRWVSERDHGQAHAINKGLNCSRGHIRAYLNSDDTLMPGAVATVVRYFQDDPGCDLVYGRAYFTNEADQVIGRYDTAEHTLDRLLIHCHICQPAAFWSRAIAEKIGPFNERLHLAMDYEYWLRIARAGGQIVHVPEFLACSRDYAQTKTRTGRLKSTREIVEITRAAGGFTSSSYLRDFWEAFCHQSPGLLSRLGRTPGLIRAMTLLHYLWWNPKRRVLRRMAGLAARDLERRLAPCPGVAMRFIPRLRRHARLAPHSKVVFGCWEDHWMEPTVTIACRDQLPGGVLMLTGTAPVDMRLEPWVDGRPLPGIELRAGESETICLGPLARPGRILTLRFSEHIVDAEGRRVSFRIQETNLFAEQDFLSAAG
jgi:glycosyltransferase involved in cell wall biosynthesis